MCHRPFYLLVFDVEHKIALEKRLWSNNQQKSAKYAIVLHLPAA